MGESDVRPPDEPTAMAHYLWPLVWLGEAPRWATPEGNGGPINLADLADLLIEEELPYGIRFSAFRDGMLMFDLREWASPVPLGSRLADGFEPAADYQVRCVRLMNAHLACLYAFARGRLRANVLSPGRVFRVRPDGSFLGSGADPSTFESWSARIGPVTGMADWRLRRSDEAISLTTTIAQTG